MDLNESSKDGTLALASKSFSNNGNLLAYGFCESGSDWTKIKIRDVETGEDLTDVLEDVKFPAMAWTHDSNGFFYSVSQLYKANNTSNLTIVFLLIYLLLLDVALPKTRSQNRWITNVKGCESKALLSSCW